MTHTFVYKMPFLIFQVNILRIKTKQHINKHEYNKHTLTKVLYIIFILNIAPVCIINMYIIYSTEIVNPL